MRMRDLRLMVWVETRHGEAAGKSAVMMMAQSDGLRRMSVLPAASVGMSRKKRQRCYTARLVSGGIAMSTRLVEIGEIM